MDYWNVERIENWEFVGLISRETSAICFEIQILDQVFVIPVGYEDWARAVGKKAKLRLVPRQYENYEVLVFENSKVRRVWLDPVELYSRVVVSKKEYELAHDKIEKGLVDSVFQFAKKEGWIDNTIRLTQGEIPVKCLIINVERLIPMKVYIYLYKNKEVKVEESPLYKMTCRFEGFLYKNPNREVVLK